MADRNYGGGRDWDRDWNEERYGRGGFRGEGRSGGREYEDRGSSREPYGQEWNRGWGSGAGGEWNRGGMGGGDWNREGWGGYSREQFGGRDFGGDWERGSRHPGYNPYYGAGAGYGGESSRYNEPGFGSVFGSYGGSPWTREHDRWSGGGTEGGGIRRGSFAGRGPRGWRRSDERIREEINEALTRDPDVDASEVEVRVENGVVTLSGVVEDRGQKRRAEDIAEDIFGIDDVNNELKIRHGFLAGLTGEKADEREVSRRAEREPTTAAASTGRGGGTRGKNQESTSR